MQFAMSIEVNKSKSNGGEFFVYTDGSLMGVYAHLEKVAERLGEEVASRVLSLAEYEEDEEDEESGDCFHCGAVMESDGCSEKCQG